MKTKMKNGKRNSGKKFIFMDYMKDPNKSLYAKSQKIACSEINPQKFQGSPKSLYKVLGNMDFNKNS